MIHNEIATLIIGIGLVLAIPLNYLEKQHQAKNPRPTKILLARGSGIGEAEQSHRIEIAAKRLGVDLVVVQDYPKGKVAKTARHVKPDLILTIERNIPPVDSFPNYLVLDQSKEQYITIGDDGKPTLLNPEHYKFSGLLPTFPDIETLKQAYEYTNKPFYGMYWYPSVYATKYATKEPKRVFYPGGVLTDNTRATVKYKNFFALLDQKDYLDIYGFEDRWLHTPRSIRGLIPFNGMSLIKTNNKSGITLLLHAKDHLNGDVPTGRIFEAAAANTVIISDKNQFVIKNFGDNILYIDVNQDEQAVFEQIDKHVQWIFANPEQAKKMAQNCHDIFMRDFTMEVQLQRLIKLNENRKVS